jgi:SAM-dependent methyltransferase
MSSSGRSPFRLPFQACPPDRPAPGQQAVAASSGTICDARLMSWVSYAAVGSSSSTPAAEAADMPCRWRSSATRSSSSTRARIRWRPSSVALPKQAWVSRSAPARGISAQVDVVLCHDVLEVADDPGAGLVAAAAALRPGGILSLLAANRSAAVLGRVLAGRFEAAEHVLSGDAPTGTDRALRRFDLDELVALTSAVGLSVVELSGDRVFSDLVPGAALDIEPHSQEVLARLEAIVARLPVYRSMATRLHLLARKPEADTLAAK